MNRPAYAAAQQYATNATTNGACCASPADCLNALAMVWRAAGTRHAALADHALVDDTPAA